MSELAKLQAQMDDVKKDAAETAAFVRVIGDAIKGDDAGQIEFFRSQIQALENELVELHKRNIELTLKNQDLTKLARFDPSKWSRMLAGINALKKLVMRYEHPELFGWTIDFYASNLIHRLVLDLKPILKQLDTD